MKISLLHFNHSRALRVLQHESEQLHSDQKAGLHTILSSLAELKARINSVNGHPNQTFTADEVREVERKFNKMSLSENDIAKEQSIIKSLTFESLPARFEAITEAHRQTFKWALESSGDSAGNCALPAQSGTLGHWLLNGEDMFWVSGKPGSGKSTLMKFISTEPRTNELLFRWAFPKKAVIVTHYFWNGGTPMQRSLRGLLQTLLYEVVRQCPRIIPIICPNQWADPDSPTWTISTLRISFENFVKRCGDIDSKFCFFIDGMDEYDGDHAELCKIFSDFAKSANIKVCLSSRPWNVFDAAFGHGTAKLHVHELTKVDIRNYAASRLHGHPRWNLVVTNLEDGQWLVDQITDRAWGVFLWATLVTKLLLVGLTNRDRFSDMHRRLNSFPTELEPFFMKILTSIESFYRSKMATTLLLALAAEAPLPYLCYEFHDQEYDDRAYAVKMASRRLTKAELKDIRESTISRLESRTRGLLELPVGRQTVTFLHRTVMDFLNGVDMKQYLHTQITSTWNFCAELSIFKSHLAIIKTIEGRGRFHRLEFGFYKIYRFSIEDIYEDFDGYIGEGDHNYQGGTSHTITKRALLYGARLDAEDRVDLCEELAQNLDEMDRVLAHQPQLVGSDWHADACFREQLVISRAFNYLERKFLENPAYILNLGKDLAMYLVRPCYSVPERAISQGGMIAVGKDADLFRKGLRILRRAVESHYIDPDKKGDDDHTAWSSLLSLLVSKSPQCRLLLVGLLESDILSGFLQQGADPAASLKCESTGNREVAWAAFLSWSFDIPPVDTIRTTYLRTLSGFLGSDVDLASSTEPATGKNLIFGHFLDPLKEAVRFGKLDALDLPFMCKIAAVLVREAKGSTCLVREIREAIQGVLGPEVYEYLRIGQHDLASSNKRKWKSKEVAIDGEIVGGPERKYESRKKLRGTRLTK